MQLNIAVTFENKKDYSLPEWYLYGHCVVCHTIFVRKRTPAPEITEDSAPALREWIKTEGLHQWHCTQHRENLHAA